MEPALPLPKVAIPVSVGPALPPDVGKPVSVEPALPPQEAGKPASAEPPLPPPPPPATDALTPVAERKIREYRYRTRIIKATILPVFFAVMSIWMLYNYVNSYEPNFAYDFNVILPGFGVGFIFMSGFVLVNMRKARKEGSTEARQRYAFLIILAFLIPYAYLILLVSPAQAWRFSIGYFASALLTPVVVMAYESLSEGKFFVLEEDVNDRLTRTLVFRH